MINNMRDIVIFLSCKAINSAEKTQIKTINFLKEDFGQLMYSWPGVKGKMLNSL